MRPIGYILVTIAVAGLTFFALSVLHHEDHNFSSKVISIQTLRIPPRSSTSNFTKLNPYNDISSSFKRKNSPKSTNHLISLHKPVFSDVRGNLGPPKEVTNETITDWLRDRWQAASDMMGTPIPGEHWLVVDLQALFAVTKIVIDWEDAYSENWIVQGSKEYLVDRIEAQSWILLGTSQEIKTVDAGLRKHIVHSLNLSHPAEVRYVRLLIKQPSTVWGVSVSH